MSLLVFSLLALALVALLTAIARWWSREGAFTTIVGVVAAFIVGFIWLDQYLGNYAHDHVATCQITGTDGGGGNGSYRVYTKDCGTLSNHDTWLRGKTKSADVQGQIVARLTEPHTNPVILTMEIAGVRFGPTSAMPNIIKIVSTN